MEVFFEHLNKYNLFPHIAISEKCENIISVLEKSGVSVLKIRKNPKLSEPIAYHADCNLLKLDNSNYICDKDQYENIVNYFTSCKIKQGRTGEVHIYTENIFSPYPNDVKINVWIIENNIICNEKSVSDIILDFANRCSYNLIHVKQGYSACSSLKLSDSSLITDDETIYRACIKNGIDALKISKGKIKLNGYNYGFIGGASGLIAHNLAAFNGNINYLDNKDELVSFLNKHNTDYICFDDAQLNDIGGIISL